MILVSVLKNGAESNLLLPATKGDFGFDLVAQSDPKIVGDNDSRLLGELSGCFRSISYIEYDTGLVVAPSRGRVARDYSGHKAVSDTSVSLQEHVHWTSLQERESISIAGLIFPRSSISKYNLVLANSVPVIDAGYRGTIKLRFKYIVQPEDLRRDAVFDSFITAVNLDKIYKKGDKIAQIAWVQREETVICQEEELEDSVRGGGGFGSSGN